MQARRCPGWILFASDPFLGELKATLGDAARKALLCAEPCDLTASDGRQLGLRATATLEAVC